jgi:hypothetical protein
LISVDLALIRGGVRQCDRHRRMVSGRHKSPTIE